MTEYFGVFAMQGERQGTDLQDTLQEDAEVETISCPNCQSTVPATLYCLKCGYPLFNVKENLVEGEDDSVEAANKYFDHDSLMEMQEEMPSNQAENPMQHTEDIDEDDRIRPGMDVVMMFGEEDESTIHNKPPSQGGNVESGSWSDDDEKAGLEYSEETLEEEDMIEELEPGLEPGTIFDSLLDREAHMDTSIDDSPGEACEDEPRSPAEDVIQGLARDLMNSISLKLWSMELLQEGGIEEDHFTKIFGGYRARFEHCMDHRNELLEQAKDLEELEGMVNEAKVELGELGVRKSLGDLYEGEYEALAPALEWTINHYEDQIETRREKISLLENLIQLMPRERIEETKEMAANVQKGMEHLVGSENVAKKTIEKVRKSLEEILELLEAF
ncbi:MAG: hypothetical protein JSV18_06260 [Candidatus Bathyarchaeota archaeon]|nr:MAG: hypothetical protein JSV18_06260 [Candidatus Bathyarchaeota archaeon]